MADIPSIRTKEQIIRDITNGLIARNPSLNDFNTGSVISQFIEAIAQSQFKAYADVIGMVDSLSVDRAVGEALQRLAVEKNVPILPARTSTGTVDITSTSFEKIASFVYYGQPAPVAGSLVFYIVDGAKANPAGGQLYIGRGTVNLEGPLTYTSVTPESGGSYYKVTLASTSPTTRFHNAGEQVVFAQGGTRIIPAGTELKTAKDIAAEPISFITTSEAKIIDGEVTVYNVPVASKDAGKKYNVPKGAIKEIVGLSFKAIVTNPFATSNGRDADIDEDIRQRIKDYEKAKSKGTESAIRLAALNVTDTTEQKSVDSTNIIRYADNSAALIFDDGTGYEPSYSGALFETIIDEAVGGEKEVQLRKRPIAQARVKCVYEGPYNITNLSGLRAEVNGIQTEHLFKSSDFRVPSSATPVEIASSINSSPDINFSASTSDNGTKVVIYPRDREFNAISVKTAQSDYDSNDALGFPVSEEVTLRLYKNDQPLKQDGATAKISTMNKGLWGNATSGDTLKYIVDGTQELEITFTNTDFQLIDSSAVMSTNTSIDIWAKVFDLKMPGVDAAVNGDVVDFISNRGISNLAKLEFTGGTLLTKIFSSNATLKQTGAAPDYKLNKQTGQISLVSPLSTGDKLTAGSQFTRANVQTKSIESGPTVAGKIWMIVDGKAESIPNGLSANSLISFQKTGTKLAINSSSSLGSPEGFESAESGDWVLVWANPADPSSLQLNSGFWRIESTETGQIIVDSGAYGITTSQFVPLTNRIQIVRSDAPIQLLDFSVDTLNNFAQEIEEKIVGVDAEIVGSSVRISTKSFNSNGEIFIVAADQNGETLQLPVGTVKTNISSHYGFVVTDDSEAGFPSFTYGELGAAISDVKFTETSYEKLGGKNSDFIELLSKYDTASKPTISPDSNQKRRVFVTDFNQATSALTLLPKRFMQSGASLIQEGDRYFIRSAYSFDPKDNISVVVDNDNFTKSFSLPVSRKITVSDHSTPSTQDFSANDAQSSLLLNDTVSFFGFDFNNFKLLRQAHSTLTDGNYSIKLKSYDFGKMGNKYRVGFIYPDNLTAVSSLNHKISIAETLSLGLVLPVTEPRSPNWDYTSAFTVSKTTTGGKDSITYKYRVGTQPDFSSTGALINIGDIALINGTTSFLSSNKNIKGKVTNVTATEFTIEVPSNGATDDIIQFSEMINNGTTITITTPSLHYLKKNDRIGIWNTQSANGSTYPFNTTYVVKSATDYSFTVSTPTEVPGGTITNANLPLNSEILTINSTLPHGLSVGNIVKISTGNSNIDGLSPVVATPSLNQFQVLKHGSSLTAYQATGGTFAFQSFGVSTSWSLGSVIKAGNTVTAYTSSDHSLTAGDIVKIESVEIEAWSPAVSYDSNSIISYGSQNYVGIGINTPEISSYGNFAAGINEITDLPSVSGIVLGMAVGGSWHIPAGTIVTAIDPLNLKVTISNAPTGSAVAINIYFATTPTNSIGTKWNLTDFDLTGTFVVQSTPLSNTFTYYYQHNGNVSGFNGSSTKLIQMGSLARCLNSSEGLQFAKVETTAQEVVDYVSTNLSEEFTAKLANSNSTAIIDTSTEDLQAATSYLSGNITAIEKSVGSRNIKITSNTEVVAGSTIKISGLGDYNGSFVVLSSKILGTDYILEIHSPVLASSSGTSSVLGTFVGSTPYFMLKDGENFVQTTELGSLIGFPQFYAKNQWTEAPEMDEEIYIVATNSDQLVRFWNKSVVTGLSNVAKIENSEYERQIQITTNTFGNQGSIKVTGGTGNAVNLALVGSASQLNDKLGLLYVPIEIKKGIVEDQWIKVENQIKQNKIIGLGTGTNIEVFSDGVGITSSVPSTGTFQTLRLTEQTEETVVKIERHGDFVALISVDGPSFNLASAGVKEGDWVRINNVDAPAWSSTGTYVTGQRVNYNGFNYTSLQDGNTGNNPKTESSWWDLREFDQTNEGIYQIVRTFGENALWIKHENAVEGIHYLGNSGNINVYSYDSVMPGDVLVITTNILGSQNVGRYEVVDESYGTGYSFPTNSRIYTKALAAPTSGSVNLGGEFSQINIEENLPIVLWKKVFSIGPASNTLAAIFTDSPDLITRTGESLGSYVTGYGKTAFNTSVNFGVDAYKYYKGLIKELNRVVYGDPSDSYNYPGIRAAGTDIDIRPATTKRIKVGLAVRIKSGTPFSQIRERIKALVAAYINDLGAGEQVSISKCIAAAGSVSGVSSVAITYPTYDSSNDLISVAASEKPIVLDPTTDIIVSLIE